MHGFLRLDGLAGLVCWEFVKATKDKSLEEFYASPLHVLYTQICAGRC